MASALFALACTGAVSMIGNDRSLSERAGVTVELHPMTSFPADYRAWWADLEECSGASRNFDGVAWFVTDTPGDIGFECEQTHTDRCYGLYLTDSNTIIMDDDFAHLYPWVGHEMLHSLGFDHGDPVFGNCGVKP